ncbi:MAG: glycosyltransferase [Candidatus Hadarchaeales archaeon]
MGENWKEGSGGLPRPDEVSAVMTVYNNADQLAKFFESFLEQTYPVREIEFVIVDAGSTDGTVEVAKKYSEKLPKLKIMVEPGCNISRGRNLGIRETKGRYILTFNSDVRLEKNCVEELLKVLMEHPEAGGVAGMQVFPESQNFVAKCVYFIPGMAQVSLVTTPTLKEKDIVETHSVPCECGVWRREALPEGLFDEKIQWGEDSEFHFRMMKSGWKIYGTRRARFEHFYKSSVRKFWRQQVAYGYGAGLMFRLGKEIGWGFRWKRYVALFLPFAVVAWAVLTAFWPILGLLLFILGISPLLLISVKAAVAGGPKFFPGVFSLLIVKYFANEVGFWKALLRRSP